VLPDMIEQLAVNAKLSKIIKLTQVTLPILFYSRISVAKTSYQIYERKG
jgi:hypothetical protein